MTSPVKSPPPELNPAALCDLYEALKELSKFYEGTDSPLNAIAQAALAKAEART